VGLPRQPEAGADWYFPACPFCKEGARPRHLFTVRRPILRCGCGLVYAGRRRGETLAAAYGETYFQGLVYADYLADRAAIRKNAAHSLAHLEERVAGRRLLDAGCAAGFFLEAARDRGWSVFGLELSEYALAHARDRLGLTAWRGSIEAPPAELAPVDVVTLWDVIEHLENPLGALERIRRLLLPGGRLVLSTGDFDCLLRRTMGRRWRIFSDPTHLYFFSNATLRRLLQDAGFQVLDAHHGGKRVSLAMMLQQAGVPSSRVVARMLGRLPIQPYLYVNLWDVVTVTAAPVPAVS